METLLAHDWLPKDEKDRFAECRPEKILKAARSSVQQSAIRDLRLRVEGNDLCIEMGIEKVAFR